ncbi:hypothetical protein WJX73_009877 [Symbiochloris irregularis]|uniref:L-ascorbate peroxidase n=1 Tax=Symbiochloris irregularis TaxID=706552 RepID=A0AAW1PRA6_9CHLO
MCTIARASRSSVVQIEDSQSETVGTGSVLSDTRRALQKIATKAKAPVLLRLVFHDAGTYLQSASNGGANASIRFELKRPENTGLNRGWSLIAAIKKELEGTAAAQLSHADLIALAGAHAVATTGGPVIKVPIGRADASAEDPKGRLPEETLTADQLRQAFAAKGLGTRDFVALSGAHTLGNKGFGEPLSFDNAYYKSLLNRPWNDPNNSMAAMIGLPSDHVLADDPACLDMIKGYADDQDVFFTDFSASFLKLASLGAQWA